MDTNLKILLLEDSGTDAEIIQRLLLKELPGVEIKHATNKKGFLKILNDFPADVILSDNSLLNFDATEALQIVRQQFSNLPFILVTGTVSEEFAAGIIKQGADDYILKDRLTRLPNAILTAYKNRKDERERKKVQEQLLEREKQLELFIMHSPAALAMFDNEMRYLAVSNRWCSDYNLECDKILGVSHYTVFPEIPNRWKEIHLRVLKGAIEKNEEDLLIREDGSESWLRWEVRPWYKASGEIGGIIIFTEDITQKRKAAEEFLQSKMRLQQAQEIAHLGNWEFNFATQTSKWSDEAYRIYGIPFGRSNISQEEWLNFIHPEDREEIQKQIAASAKTLSDFAIEHRIVRKDGSIRYVYTKSRYELDDQGRPLGLYGVVHDITDRKMAEEDNKKLQQELLEKEKNEQIKSTEIMLRAQEKERAAIGQELHDNVNQILVGTQLLLSTVKGNEDKSDTIITDCMDNLKNAIQENRKIAHELVGPDLTLDTLIHQLKQLMTIMLGSQHIKTVINSDEFLDDCLDNDQKLAVYRIAQEQCTNIVKYADATIVTINLSVRGNEFFMNIADNGRGMDDTKKISGIGIRNINSRLSIFHGSLAIITAPGAGFTLEIRMPCEGK